MIRVLRITRHAASEEQLAELKRIYGDIEVIQISENVDANRVRALVAEHKPQVLEAVLPMNIVAELTSGREPLPCPLIRAVMKRRFTDEAKTNAVFDFDHFERVIKVEVVSEPLTPNVS